MEMLAIDGSDGIHKYAMVSFWKIAHNSMVVFWKDEWILNGRNW